MSLDKFWVITESGEVEMREVYDCYAEDYKKIGNYFKSRMSAESALSHQRCLVRHISHINHFSKNRSLDE